MLGCLHIDLTDKDNFDTFETILNNIGQLSTIFMVILKTEKLSERRSNLCLKFIKQCEKSPKYSNWFKLSEQRKHPNVKTRNHKNNQPKYEPVPFRTERYGRSPLPFLTTMLNEYYASKK